MSKKPASQGPLNRITVFKAKWKWQVRDLQFLSSLFLLIFYLAILLNGTYEISAANQENKEEIGFFSYQRNLVQRKAKGSLIWEKIKDQNTLAYQGDTIRVAKGATATVNITIADTKLDIDSDSIVVLDFSSDRINRSIQAKKGALRIKKSTQDILGNYLKDYSSNIFSKIFGYINFFLSVERIKQYFSSQKLSLKFKDKEVTILKGEVEVSTNPKTKSLGINILQDNTKILTQKGEEKILQSGESIKVNLNNVHFLKPLKTILLKVPVNGQSFFLFNKKKYKISFQWGKEGNDVLKFQVAKDKFFTRKNLVFEKDTKRISYKLNLKAGVYYWRIKNLKDRNKNSFVNKLYILPKKPTKLYTPQRKKIYFYQNKPALIYFSWSKNLLAQKYILEISKDTQFNKKFLVFSTQSNYYQYKLKEGNYYWRIKTILPFEKKALVTSINPFSIYKSKQKKEFKVYQSKKNEVIYQSNLAKKGKVISWVQMGEATSYLFTLAIDKYFKKIIKEKEIFTNFYILKENLNPANYFYSIKAMKQDKVIHTTTPQKFTIKQKIKPLKKKRSQAIPIIEEEKEDKSQIYENIVNQIKINLKKTEQEEQEFKFEKDEVTPSAADYKIVRKLIQKLGKKTIKILEKTEEKVKNIYINPNITLKSKLGKSLKLNRIIETQANNKKTASKLMEKKLKSKKYRNYKIISTSCRRETSFNHSHLKLNCDEKISQSCLAIPKPTFLYTWLCEAYIIEK